MPVSVTSRDNPQVKLYCRLRDKSRERREAGLLALEGARLCKDAAVCGQTMEAVFLTDRALEQYAAEASVLQQTAGQVYVISEAVASLMGETEHPQGVFALVRMPQPVLDASTLSPEKRYLALESVRDPGNLGTIVRTAEAFGIDGLILSADCCDVYSPKVLRAAMGGTLRLPIAVAADLPAAIAVWQQNGMTAYACVASGEAEPLSAISLGAGCVPVIGNEANGLTAETVAACAKRLTIPMAGRAESLNAAVAACIVLWEHTRDGR